MFARFCIFSLILIGAATVLSVRAAGPGHARPPVHARQRPRGESRCIGAQPAPLRQHPVENQPPRRAAHALPDALRKTRARHHDERPRHRTRAACWNPTPGKPSATSPSNAMQVVRPRRQPARTRMANKTHMLTRDRVVRRDLLFTLGRQARSRSSSCATSS